MKRERDFLLYFFTITAIFMSYFFVDVASPLHRYYNIDAPHFRGRRARRAASLRHAQTLWRFLIGL